MAVSIMHSDVWVAWVVSAHGRLPPEEKEHCSGATLPFLLPIPGGAVPDFLRRSDQYAVALSEASPTLSASTSTQCAVKLGGDGRAMVHR